MDSASPDSFLKKNVLHELKLRDPNLKIHPVDKATKDLHCGFTDNVINISGKVILPIFSNGWSNNDCHFFLTEGHERNILGFDNLPKVGIEVSQKYFPHFQTHKQCKSINSISPSNKDREILIISKTYKNLFLRSGKIKNQIKISHFHEPLKPIQLKGRRVPLHYVHELVDNVAAQFASDSVGEVWFTNLDLKNS